MKSPLVLIPIVALLTTTGQALADCSSSVVQNLGTLLSNKTVCGTGVGPNTGDQWQEWHQSGGTLTEYAKGASDPVDPTHDVGTWTVNNDGTASASVTYNYTDDGAYTLTVHDNGGGNYSFCTGSTEVATATLLTGQGSCGF